MDDENDQLAIDIAETDDKKDKEFIDNIKENLSEIKILFGISSRSDRYIREVPKHLRDVNKKVYEPQIIAIGPYHRSKRHLQGMEKQKLRCLNMLLQRTEARGLESYLRVMRKLEKRARACYVGTQSIASRNDEFFKMILLDACFIVVLFRNYWQRAQYNEPLLGSRSMEQKMSRDLLLPDNQIPFFVLEEFFKITKTPDENEQMDERTHFLTMIFNFFVSVLHNQSYEQDAEEVRTTGSYPFFHNEKFQDSNAVKHLLSLVHDGLVGKIVPNSGPNCNWKIFSFSITIEKKNGSDKERFHRRCATKLREAGIKFKEVKSKSLLDIKFENGIMKIPRLKINDGTESFFKNLIFYEQLYTDQSNPVIDYMNFMDSLINSEKDVELLCQHNIVDNCLGDDKLVAEMFNRLGDLVTFSSCDLYREIYEKMNKHCNRSWNRWMANLRHNYFNTPWAFISFLAAVLLLLLTAGQTVFSFLAYFKPPTSRFPM